LEVILKRVRVLLKLIFDKCAKMSKNYHLNKIKLGQIFSKFSEKARNFWRVIITFSINLNYKRRFG